MRKLLRHSLFQNSLYLLLATGVMAFFSFLFWLIASRIFPPSDVGIASTIVAVMNVIALLSLIGFDSVFIRFLPSESEKNALINTGIAAVIIAAVILSSGFLLLVDHISPTLSFLSDGILYPLSFIFFCATMTVNVLTDAIFLAHKAPQMTFFINTTFVSLRLIFLFLFREWGAAGIYFAIALSQVFGPMLGIIILTRRFSYSPKRMLDRDILKRFKGYSLGNYTAGILNLLPGSILPIMITNNLGSEKAAYYGIVMMIGNLLFTVPWMVTRSLFAEGSHDKKDYGVHVRHALMIIAALFLPGMLVLLFIGDIVLSLFGPLYAEGGFTLLRIVVVAGIFVTTTSLLETYFRVHGDPRWLILSNAFYLTTIVGCAYLFLPYGLTGIGWATILGYGAASAVSYTIFLFLRRRSA
jgi:O-antigen/teichoic acid export membrane protein